MTTKSDELVGKLEELLGQFANQAGAATGPAGWANRPASEPGSILGVAIPVKIQTRAGAVRAYVTLPPEAASSEATLQDAIDGLVAAGFPVDAWNRDGGGGRGGWSGNYNQNRGRYR